MDKASFFIVNIFFNSLMTFLTVACLIEVTIFLFRVGQGRVAASLRMVSFIKLPMDLFLYDFTRWSYAQGINPFCCEEGTRTLSILFGWTTYVDNWIILPVRSSIQLTVPGNWTFTIADLISYSIGPPILKWISIVFLFMTMCLIFRKIVLYYYSLITLESFAQQAHPLCRKIRNTSLSTYIKKCHVRILSSPLLSVSPFVAGFFDSVIYIPKHLLNTLSQKEYEAILVHEIEHIRHKDNVFRLLLDLISTLFWWIPTERLRHYIEEGQEVGCDRKCSSYGIDSTHLAAALSKSAKFSTGTTGHIFLHHLTKHPILKRLNILVQTPSIRFKKTRFLFTCLAGGIAFFVILFGRFWIF